LSDVFHSKTSLKQGDALSPLLLNFALEYAIRRVQVKQDGLKLSGKHQLVVYADVNMLGGGVYVTKNTQALVVACKETDLEVNAGNTKYTVMSRDQNAGRSHNIKIDSNSFERVEEFKYWGTTLSNQNSVQEEIKSRLKSGNACYHSVQNILSSCLLSKDTEIKIHRIMILPVVLYGCDTRPLTLMEDRSLRVFENRVLKIFGPKGDEVTREWRKVHNEALNDMYSSPNIIRVIKSRRRDGRGV